MLNDSEADCSRNVRSVKAKYCMCRIKKLSSLDLILPINIQERDLWIIKESHAESVMTPPLVCSQMLNFFLVLAIVHQKFP